MLLDRELTEIARVLIEARSGSEWVPEAFQSLSEPDGIFYWTRRADRTSGTGGPGPVFVFRDNGDGVVLHNFAAPDPWPERHAAAWSDIIRDNLRSAGATRTAGEVLDLREPTGQPPHEELVAHLRQVMESYFSVELSTVELLGVPDALIAMGEDPLAGAAGDAVSSYRFVWVSGRSAAYGERPVCVHVSFHGTVASVTTKVGDGHSFFAPGVLTYNRSRVLSAAELAVLQTLVDRAGFWAMPMKGGAQGLDGSFWVFEGRRGGRHHVVVRWSPGSYAGDRAFLDLCDHMLQIGAVPPHALPPRWAAPTEAEVRAQAAAIEAAVKPPRKQP